MTLKGLHVHTMLPSFNNLVISSVMGFKKSVMSGFTDPCHRPAKIRFSFATLRYYENAYTHLIKRTFDTWEIHSQSSEEAIMSTSMSGTPEFHQY